MVSAVKIYILLITCSTFIHRLKSNNCVHTNDNFTEILYTHKLYGGGSDHYIIIVCKEPIFRGLQGKK